MLIRKIESLVDKLKTGTKAVAEGVRDSVYSVVNHVKDNARAYAVGVGIGLVAMAYSPKAEAITFDDLIGNTTAPIEMARGPPIEDWNNLKIRDPVTGVDSPVEKDGGAWAVMPYKQDGDSIVFGAYMTNDNPLSNAYPNEIPGWCQGEWNNGVFANGSYADGAMALYDGSNDGFGDVVNGQWILGADDIPYLNNDILFNGIRGDASQLGSFNSSDKVIDTEIVIAPAPHYGLGDLADFSSYWLSGCDAQDEVCNSFDSDDNTWIDFVDFANFAQNWDPNYIAP